MSDSESDHDEYMDDIEQLITVTMPRHSKVKSAFAVELRDDGFYYGAYGRTFFISYMLESDFSLHRLHRTIQKHVQFRRFQIIAPAFLLGTVFSK
jgi:hypothetical protein